MTGAEFAALDDEEAARQIEDIGVIARVAPEHKVRLVEVLKAKHNVVAMTGTGSTTPRPSARRTSASPWASPAPMSPRARPR